MRKKSFPNSLSLGGWSHCHGPLYAPLLEARILTALFPRILRSLQPRSRPHRSRSSLTAPAPSQTRVFSYCSWLSGTWEVLRCPVCESLGAWVFTVPLLPLKEHKSLQLRFYLSGARVFTPVPFLPYPLKRESPHNLVPLRPLSLRCRRTHIRPRSLSPVWSPGPHSRVFSESRSLIPVPRAWFLTQPRLLHNLVLQTLTHCGSESWHPPPALLPQLPGPKTHRQQRLSPHDMRRLPQWSVRLSSRSDCSALPEYFRHRSPPPTRKRAALPAGGRAPGLRRRREPCDTWSLFWVLGLVRLLGFFLLVVDWQHWRALRLLPCVANPALAVSSLQTLLSYIYIAIMTGDWRPRIA